MIGSVWRSRFPADDLYDEVVVRGFFGGQSEGDLREVVVIPLVHGPAVSCPPEALRAAYELVTPETEQIEQFGDRLEDLAAQNA
jgi:hypothetical protein